VGCKGSGTGHNTDRNSENNEQVSQHEAPRKGIVTVLLGTRQHCDFYWDS
jgi:hypothetical protein